jgi:hypothetical protein
VLALAAVGGCFSMNRDAFDPDPPFTTQGNPKPTPTEWRRADGSLAQTGPTSRSAVVSVSARLPSSRPAGGDSAVAAAQPARDDQMDDALVRATMTQAKATPAASSDRARVVQASHSSKAPAEGTDDHAGMQSPSTSTVAAGCPTQLRLVNSKRISFNYEVHDGSGKAAVAVWCTQDLKSWKKVETQKHSATACIVAVKEDGLYGFILRANSDDPQDRPVTGDLPQVWVAVDTTRPVVKMLGTEMDESAKSPTLVLRWSAQDRNFGPRPMTLCYAEKLEGPWTTLAANVENTGHYEWVLPPLAPVGVYLRIQATDLMGNVGLAQTVHKLLLPQIQVVSAEMPVQPAGATGEQAAPPAPGPLLFPSIPSIDLPRPAPPRRPQISILSVEPERN